MNAGRFNGPTSPALRRWPLRIGAVFLITALVSASIGGWHVWEQINRDNRQPTLDGRSEPESFKLGIGGGETDLQLDFVHKSGAGGIALAFPFGSRTCTLMLDVPDPDGKPVSGLDVIDGKRFYDSENPTRVPNPILNTGKVQYVKILSLRDEVKVILDDELLIHFQGPSRSVAISPVLPAIRPAEKMVVAIGCKIRVHRSYSKMADVWSPFPKETEPGDAPQIPGVGNADEAPDHALRLTGAPLRLSPASKLINFQQPFTLEFWYRRTERQKKWLSLMSGSIKIELDNSASPKLHFGHGGGGNSGATNTTLDTDWHHIAVSNDCYYLMLYLDGQYVCRSNTAYFFDSSPEFRFGERLSSGHRSSSFRGDIREIRFSSIDRYPLGHAFNAPKQFGKDEHTLARIRFREDRSAIDSTIGALRLSGTPLKSVKLPSTVAPNSTPSGDGTGR